MAQSSILENSVSGFTAKEISIQVTVPKQGALDVDLTPYVPTGKTIVAISSVKLGSNLLPYIEPSTHTYTWVSLQNSDTRLLRILNTTTEVWTNYSLKLIIFLK